MSAAVDMREEQWPAEARKPSRRCIRDRIRKGWSRHAAETTPARVYLARPAEEPRFEEDPAARAFVEAHPGGGSRVEVGLALGLSASAVAIAERTGLEKLRARLGQKREELIEAMDTERDPLPAGCRWVSAAKRKRE